MVNTLAADGRIRLVVATNAQLVAADGTEGLLNLTWKAARVLVERAAEVTVGRLGAPHAEQVARRSGRFLLPVGMAGRTCRSCQLPAMAPS